MQSQSIYITRLTSNLKNWQKPSGRYGKCNSSDPDKPLYEQANGFGWEEWLFDEYFNQKENCRGFIQAFNDANLESKKIDELHLYTRYCENGNKKICYIGFIKNVEIIEIPNRAVNSFEKEKRIKELNDVGLNYFVNGEMWKKAFNIRFHRKDVTIISTDLKNKCNPLKLIFNQYRFGLYNLNKHKNIATQINKILQP